MVKSVLKEMIRVETSFHYLQRGFRPEHSVETALLRYEAAIRGGHTAAAVSDLKGAYTAVPRELLIKALKKRLTPTLAAMLRQL